MNNEMLEKLHIVEKEILRHFIDLCDDNNLKYYVIGGTLIGAIRHGGFIPWDDDIDIAMPRTDYDRLIQIMRSYENEVIGMDYYKDNPDLYFYPIRITNKNYRITEQRSKNGYSHPWIDILPIDGLPNGSISRVLFKIKLIYYRLLLGLHYVDNLRDIKRSKTQRVIIAFGKKTHIGKLVDSTKIKDHIDKTLRSNPMRNCKMSGTCMGAYSFHEFVDTSFWGEGTEVVFDGIKVNAPDRVHEYLTHMYGDYMTMPSSEDRHSHDVHFIE